MPLRLLVTGADGFVGSALCPALSRWGHVVRRAVRRAPAAHAENTVAVGDIGPQTDWSAALSDVHVVVHLAGRAHVMREHSHPQAAQQAYHATNVAGTERLTRCAAAAGVRRLVFVSSIKVNGEATTDAPFRESDSPRPEDDYGRSKWEAEQRLARIAAETGLEHVVVRPPLVYGPGVKGNLARLMQVIDRGWPLPLEGIDNRRSMIGLSNLVQALTLCAEHPDAAGQTFLVRDGRDLSTPDLIRMLAAALERPARLLPVPVGALRILARITGSGALNRLTGSLRIDDERIRTRLNWRPDVSVEAEIAAMVAAYRTAGSSST